MGQNVKVVCVISCFFAGGRVKPSHVESLREQLFVADTPEAICGEASEQQPLPDEEKNASETNKNTSSLRNVSSHFARRSSISGATPDLGT